MKNFIVSTITTISILLLFAYPKVSCAAKAPIKTTIEDVIQNPGKYYDEAVMVQGYVQEFLKKPSQTNSFYLLKGKYDGIIQVRVQYNEPSVGKKYIVEGTVYSGQNGSSVFIHQTKITEITDFYSWEESDGSEAVVTTVVKKDAPVSNPEENEGIENGNGLMNKDIMFYVLIGAIALIVIVIVIVVILLVNKNKGASNIPTPAPASQPSAAEQPAPRPSAPPVSSPAPEEDYKTIKIVRDPSRTLKFIPGELEIISGADAGKSFRLTGFPSPKGSVVTLGTQQAEGDRKFAHILIDKKFRTVSRHQAEFIFKDAEKKLYIKNISRTNLTKVNDVELQPNEEAELANGSTVTTGELTFRYTV